MIDLLDVRGSDTCPDCGGFPNAHQLQLYGRCWPCEKTRRAKELEHA